MQVNWESSREITNLEAAALINAARQRRGLKVVVPKDDAISEVQVLYYCTHDGQGRVIDPNDANVDAQGGVMARLVDCGIPVDAVIQMLNLPRHIPADARILIVAPRAEEELGADRLSEAGGALASLR